MTTHHPELVERVRSQGALQPGLYGEVDLAVTPYRFTDDPAVKSSLPSRLADRDALLADEATVDLMRTATMLGDVVADPYAALMDTYGTKGLIQMLTTACREGIDAVSEAPPELRTFIEAMETEPEWLDMDLVREGARHSRVPAAFLSPFITRGAFLGTFVNTYAALPMALTGALTGTRAAFRITETTSFFSITTLPGALERHGIGFEVTAHIRLMHSVVRYNALKRSKKWDQEVFGIPIPQVDQMPAGMINVYVLAMAALKHGRTQWTPRERAIHEFVRYRCYLLGLPEELVPAELEDVVKVFNTRAATLRDDFDDEICGGLVRSTLDAYLRKGHTPFDRAADRVEKAWSKVFITGAMGRKSRAMGIVADPLDKALVAATTPFVIGRLLLVTKATQMPLIANAADAYTLRVLNRRLEEYGVVEAMNEKHGQIAG